MIKLRNVLIGVGLGLVGFSGGAYVAGQTPASQCGLAIFEYKAAVEAFDGTLSGAEAVALAEDNAQAVCFAPSVR